MDESHADGERGPEHSFPLSFDPVAGMRAVADIQAEGLRAAGDLLERILRAEPDGPGPRQGSPAGDYTALVDAWTELLRRTVAAVAQPGRPGAVTVPVDSSGVGPPVRLTVPGPDGAGDATAEVWLHNGTRSAAGPLALRCGQLSDCGGAVLDGADVRFEPAEVDAAAAAVQPSGRGLARHGRARRAPAPTAARSRPTGHPVSGCPSRSRSTRADRRRRSARGGVRRRRRPPRPALDARRHPGRRAAPLALPRGALVPEPAGEGDPARAVRGDEPRVRRERRRHPARRRRDRAAAQRVPRPRRHRRRQPAPPRSADACGRVRPRARAERRRRAGRALQPGPATPRELHRRRPRRARPVRVRRHGAAHARGPGHRARLAPGRRGRRSSRRTTST